MWVPTKPEPGEPDSGSLWYGLWAEYEAHDAEIRALASSLAAAAAEAGTPPPLVMVGVYPSFEALGNPA